VERAANEGQLWSSRDSRAGCLVPPSFPSPANFKLTRTLFALDARIFDLIARRRTSRDKPADLLSMLMDARDEDDGSALTDAELRDELMTLLFAAHESTGATMAWSLYLLSKYPEAERRVRA